MARCMGQRLKASLGNAIKRKFAPDKTEDLRNSTTDNSIYGGPWLSGQKFVANLNLAKQNRPGR